jgi:hypothetical protein
MNSSMEAINYPENGNTLFIEEGNVYNRAWVDKSGSTFGSYADSYYHATMELLERILGNGEVPRSQSKMDYLCVPIVFLARHHLELRLKEINQALNFCLDHHNEFPKGHKLDVLWREFKGKYQAFSGEDINNEEMIAAERIIIELNDFDPNSMTFRYPVDKSGYRIQRLEYFNITNFKDVFSRVYNLLDGISMYLSHASDITSDMISEFNSELYSEYYS